MKILVTGGTGFIGQHLVAALIKSGHQVKVIARSPQKAKKLEKKGAKVVIGDLGDNQFLKKELTGMEAVYHLAAISGQLWGISWEEYERVNVTYTKNLLKASLERKIKRFIFCSSIQAADPSTFYGRSKLQSEKAAQRSGLNYTIVRPAVVYGPGEARSFLRISRFVRRGFFPLPDGGKSRFAIVYIDDLVDLFLKCLGPKAKKKMFWGIGTEVPFKKYVKMISDELGAPCLIISAPALFLKAVAVPFEFLAQVLGVQPLLSRVQIDFMTTDWYFERSQDEKKFWQPKVKLETGIKKTISWYQKEGLL